MIRPNHLSTAMQELGGSQTLGSAVPETTAEPLTRAAAVEHQEQPEVGGGLLARGARGVREAPHRRESSSSIRANVSRTAQALGLSRAALQKKMKTYGLR